MHLSFSLDRLASDNLEPRLCLGLYLCVDREVFLQANYRFAITASADVKQLASDADRMIDWEDVVQVLLRFRMCSICMCCGHCSCRTPPSLSLSAIPGVGRLVHVAQAHGSVR